MKKRIPLIITFILIFVLFSVGSFFAIQKISGNKTHEVQKVIHEIQLTDTAITPNDLAIKVGEYVQFNSKDKRKHTIIQGKDDTTSSTESNAHNHGDSGVNLKSPEFGEGEGYLVNFKQAGTYYFHDNNYPNDYILVLAYVESNANKQNTTPLVNITNIIISTSPSPTQK